MPPSCKVVVLLKPDQYEAAKAEAGSVPMSEWIRSHVTGSRSDRVKALLRGCGDGELEAVLGAIQEVLAEKEPR